jgi:hypothetical protein
MDKILRIKNRRDPEKESDYWKTVSYQERIDAIEILRQQYFVLVKGTKDVQQGLQRVCKIVKSKSR